MAMMKPLSMERLQKETSTKEKIYKKDYKGKYIYISDWICKNMAIEISHCHIHVSIFLTPSQRRENVLTHSRQNMFI